MKKLISWMTIISLLATSSVTLSSQLLKNNTTQNETEKQEKILSAIFIGKLFLGNGEEYKASINAIRNHIVEARFNANSMATRIDEVNTGSRNRLIQLVGRQEAYFILDVYHEYTGPDESHIRAVISFNNLYLLGIIADGTYYHFGDVEEVYQTISEAPTGNGVLARSGNYNNLIGSGTVEFSEATVLTMLYSLTNFNPSNHEAFSKHLVMLIALISEALRFSSIEGMLAAAQQTGSGNTLDWASRIRETAINWQRYTINFLENVDLIPALSLMMILCRYKQG